MKTPVKEDNLNEIKSLEDMARDKFKAEFVMKDGSRREVELNIYLVGKFLVTLEHLRQLMGEATLWRTLGFCHLAVPEFQFVRDLIAQEHPGKGKEATCRR